MSKEDCPEPSSWWARIKRFIVEVLNNIAVRVSTLIVTGILVAKGYVSVAIVWLIDLLSQIATMMPSMGIPAL